MLVQTYDPKNTFDNSVQIFKCRFEPRGILSSIHLLNLMGLISVIKQTINLETLNKLNTQVISGLFNTVYYNLKLALMHLKLLDCGR